MSQSRKIVSILFRLTLLVIIAVQAAYIHRQNQKLDTLAQQHNEPASELEQRITLLETVLEAKDKTLEALNQRKEVLEEDNRELVSALALAQDELEQIGNQLTLSFGTVRESGADLARLIDRLEKGVITDDGMNTIYTLIQEAQFLDEIPEDFAAFHSSFVTQSLNLPPRIAERLELTLLDYGRRAFANGLFKRNEPQDESRFIWQEKRNRLGRDVLKSVQGILSSEHARAFQDFYDQGIFNPPGLSGGLIEKPIIITREEFEQAGRQIILQVVSPEEVEEAEQQQ